MSHKHYMFYTIISFCCVVSSVASDDKPDPKNECGNGYCIVDLPGDGGSVPTVTIGAFCAEAQQAAAGSVVPALERQGSLMKLSDGLATDAVLASDTEGSAGQSSKPTLRKSSGSASAPSVSSLGTQDDEKQSGSKDVSLFVGNKSDSRKKGQSVQPKNWSCLRCLYACCCPKKGSAKKK